MNPKPPTSEPELRSTIVATGSYLGAGGHLVALRDDGEVRTFAFTQEVR